MNLSKINKGIGVVLFVSIPLLSKASGNVKTNPMMNWAMENILLIIASLVILGAFLSLWNLLNAVMENKAKEILKEQGIEPKPKVRSSETFLSRWINKYAGFVPIEKEHDLELDHNYDGIRELDNSLPPWWLYGFYLTILIAIGYLYVYHYSDIGLSQQEEYEVAMEKGERQKAEFAALQANNLDEENLIALLDANSLQVGMDAFKSNCAACHGQEGQGGVGPNLTDNYWIKGGSVPHIYQSIKNGSPEKGMIAWRNQMQPTTIHKIASFIKTMQGTNPPNQKKSEGVLYEESEQEIEPLADK